MIYKNAAISNSTIGERLRDLREDRGQSKRFVAKAIGVSYRTICAYEYGERIPIDSIKVKLAEHFGVSVESIFFAS